MARWSESFESHRIHDTLSQLREWASIDNEDVDSEQEAERLRFLKVIDKISTIIEGLDPDLFPESTVTQIDSHLRHQNVWKKLSLYSSDGNIDHLKMANDHITNHILEALGIGVPVRSPEARRHLRAIEEAYESFCKAIDNSKNKFEESISQNKEDVTVLAQSIDKLKEDFNGLKNNVDDAFSNWQSAFTNEETKRAKEHSDAQIERSNKFNESIQDFKDKAEKERVELSKKYDDSLKDLYREFSEVAKEKLSDMKDKHQSILDIHELVATESVAGGYKKNADDERKAANRWGVTSMLCYSLILIWVIFKGQVGFGYSTDDVLDWPMIVTTLSVTAVAFVAAQFASRQSRLHRINEQRMRWFSLEVKAIDPFISSLPVDMQQELKRQLSERLFGRDRVADDGLEVGQGPKDKKELLETIKATGSR